MPAKDTEQLENELKDATDVEKFLTENAENFREFTLKDYLRKLIDEKNLVMAQVIRDSQLDEGYAKKIFRGDTKQPARKKILSLALAMGLSPKETDYLLYYAGHNKLYSRNVWDDVITFALTNHKTVDETNELLSNMNLEPLQ
ncbi:MAG: hypothetical protein IKN27_02220 [Selenomonadaceae bacterium]|nr:hypothetical protein [Selenomonadaceae bacterium]